MNSIKFIASGNYLPKKVIDNKYLSKLFNVEENWIYQRTGIEKRFWEEEEKTSDLAIKAVRNLKDKTDIDLKKVGLIIVASTNVEQTMPGISFEIQKELDIQNCMCMDILAGCSGYINALDIARKYKLDRYKSKLDIFCNKLFDLQNEIEDYIEKIEDSSVRQIFRYRYIDNLSWNKIQILMNFKHEDTARKRHDKYLEEN